MGNRPHTPDPPFLTFSTRCVEALSSPLYLLAASRYAGPITLLLMAWQLRQSLPLAILRAFAASTSARAHSGAAIVSTARTAKSACFIAISVNDSRRFHSGR